MTIRKFLYATLLLPVCACLLSCAHPTADVSFPEEASEFSQPSVHKLTFATPQELAWKTIPSDPTPETRTFRLNDLPLKPLDVADFRPLRKPLSVASLQWENLPGTPLYLDSIPARKLTFRTSLLGVPKRVKASAPRLKDSATQSIFLFGHDQGLPGTVGQAVAQDKHGMIWLATDNGLGRYDGEFCTIYSEEEGLNSNWGYQILFDRKGKLWLRNPARGLDVIDLKLGVVRHIDMHEGLVGNYATHMAEDSEGLIWVTTEKGVNIIDEQAGTVRQLDSRAGIAEGVVMSVLEDHGKRIWLSIPGKGLQVIDRKANTIKQLNQESGLPDNRAVLMMQDKNRQLWFSLESQGTGFFHPETGRVYTLNTAHGLADNRVSGILEDERGNMWIGTNGGGVSVYNPATQHIRNFSSRQGLSNDNIISILLDNAGQVWMGTYGGEFNVYNTKAINLQHFTSAQGLSNTTFLILGLAEDKDGRIWVGSYGAGVDILDTKNRRIHVLDSLTGLNDNRVYTIYKERSSNMWIGTDRGLDYVDLVKGRITQVLKNVPVHAVAEDEAGQVWVGTRNGIYLLNKAHTLIKHATLHQGQGVDFISALTIHPKGSLFAVSRGELHMINAKADTSRQLLADKYSNRNYGWSLLPDHMGRIWVSSNGSGASMLDENLETVTKFLVQHGMANNYVLSLLEKDGRLYVGTGKGLTILSPKASSGKPGKAQVTWDLKSYAKPQGFLRVDFNPPSILTQSGQIWWATADVLTTMDGNQAEQNVPPPPAYITAISINEQPQSFVSQGDHKKIFASTDTLWETAGKQFYLQDQLPPDSGYLAKNRITWDSTDSVTGMPANLLLPHDQNHLTFHFTGNHLSNGDKTRYRFYLEGNDKAWSPVTAEAFADYRNLAPGDYRFRVRSRNFDGLWSQEASLAFTISPPWWQSWWAYGLYALLFIIAIRGYIVLRSQSLRKENRILEEKITHRTAQLQKSLEELKAAQTQLIQSEKMASLGELTAGIAHEIQNPLNFVNNFSEVSQELVNELKEEKKKAPQDGRQEEELLADLEKNLQKIQHHGLRADAIVKNMLQHSRASAGERQPTDLNALADEYLRLAYQGLRSKNKSFQVNLETHLDPTLEHVEVVPQEIGRVFLNLFHNAFYAVQQKQQLAVSGLKGEEEIYVPSVSVTTRKLDGKVEIRVRDNGVGIPESIRNKIFQPFFTTKPTGQGTGLGLSLSYDIITKGHGGELKVETKEDEYTELIITLPDKQ